ncbi:MAG: response regulator [Nitrospirota bacterium]|nr:response regulator [Nitrospirota bacterium]
MRNVLIVEDSRAIRSLIRITLEEAGDFLTAEAANGFEALKMLPGRKFDLIITDINMPDINGLELMGFVKANPAYQNIPLVIVSTEKSDEDKKRGMAMGAVGYIVKPFRKEELVAAVNRALEGK